jgi:hypothetical protein
VAPPSDIPGAVRQLVERFYDNARAVMRPDAAKRRAAVKQGA